MRAPPSIPTWLAAAILSAGMAAHAQQPAQNSTASPAPSPVPQHDTLDRVIAVVNNRAILASDVDEMMRLSILEPVTNTTPSTPVGALRRLISRTLIQQQIRQEDALAAEPTQKEVDERLTEVRKTLPACARLDCVSEAGWAAFLSAHGLTAESVQAYMRGRSEILGFIENRFRGGIRIPEEDIERYYREILLPQYAPGTAAPPLSSVSARIEEILLQQQVNALFVSWLDNLRKQGDVEILDPAFESALPAAPAQTPAGAQPQ